MTFCTKCGQKLEPGIRFCTHCGAPATDAAAPVQQDAPAIPSQPSVTERKRSSALPVALAVLALIVVLGIGGLVWAGYTVKQKAVAFLHETAPDRQPAVNSSPGATPAGSPSTEPAPATPQKGDDVDKGIDAIGGIMDRMGFGDPPPNPYAKLEFIKSEDVHSLKCPPLGTADAVKPTAGRIPLRKGLLLIGTWGRKWGDVDSITEISAIQPEAIRVRNSGIYFTNDDDPKGKPNSQQRDVCAADLQNADGYTTGYAESDPLVAPGTTTSVLSAAVFHQLKTTGKATLKYLIQIKADDGSGIYLHWQQAEFTRVEPGDVPYPVIVNDEKANLPAIHAKGIMLVTDKLARETGKSSIDKPTPMDIDVLDDPLNPIMLLFKDDNDSFRIQITKIQFPNEEKKIEQELSKNKKAVVYGIYFDFNSDKIKPESKQVLDEIADALKNNPDWKLTVDGHTDNIGGDAYNLDLSKRRSASVKQALVTRYHIAPERLSSTGSGVAGAIDTNDTIVGRSHNRRVELTRQ
jgi:outer membrane protein OmpA-like peptidoglycan-associated protein